MLRAVRLVGIAAQAESRRLKVHAGGYVNSAVYYGAAALFGLAAMAMLHVLAFNAFLGFANHTGAALILLVIDLVIAGGLALVAARGARRGAASRPYGT